MSVSKKATRSNSKDEPSDFTSTTISDKLDGLLKEMQEFRMESREMAKSIDVTHEKIDDLTKLVKVHDGEIKDCKQKLSCLNNENVHLKRQVEDLKAEVNACQQYSRANCVDIDGVPFVKGENILTVVQAVTKAVKFVLKPEMVDAVHRLPRRSNNVTTSPQAIIIKFVRRSDKDELLRLAKVKPGFAASDAGFVSENKIFFRHSMSYETLALFLQTKSFARDQGYKFVWFANGKILMRKTDGARVIHVTSKVDIMRMGAELRQDRKLDMD